MGDSNEAMATLITGAVDLARPVVESGCRLIDDLLGKPCRVSGALLSDQIYAWQWANRIRIANRAREILDKYSVPEQVLPTGFLVPLLDQIGNVDQPELQNLWAQLLASAVESELARHPSFVSILSQLSIAEGVLIAQDRRLIHIGARTSTADHAPILQWVADNRPETEMHVFTEEEIGFLHDHLKNLGLGNVETHDSAWFDEHYNFVAKYGVIGSIGVPTGSTPEIHFWIKDIVFYPSRLGEVFLKACTPPQNDKHTGNGI